MKEFLISCHSRNLNRFFAFLDDEKWYHLFVFITTIDWLVSSHLSSAHSSCLATQIDGQSAFWLVIGARLLPWYYLRISLSSTMTLGSIDPIKIHFKHKANQDVRELLSSYLFSENCLSCFIICFALPTFCFIFLDFDVIRSSWDICFNSHKILYPNTALIICVRIGCMIFIAKFLIDIFWFKLFFRTWFL